MSSVESMILARQLGSLGGRGASWIARFLPNLAHQRTLELPESLDDVRGRVEAVLATVGRPIPELPSEPGRGTYVVLTGSGTLGLNPTIVRVEVSAAAGTTRVLLHAVAKEGLIRQHSARSAIERLEVLPRHDEPRER